MNFTREEFFRVFIEHNEALWPLQVITITAALSAVGLCFKSPFRAAVRDRLLSGLLAGYWFLTGAVYHWGFFSEVNPMAWVFGGANVLAALLFVEAGLIRRSLRFARPRGIDGWVGGALIAYAMAIYPLIGALGGHIYPAAPLLGTAPCPTTIFTLGILLWTDKSAPMRVWIIPVLWSFTATAAALQFEMAEDWGLTASGLVSIALLARRRLVSRRLQRPR